MSANRTANVTWRGGLFDGTGTIDTVTSTAVANLPVSWPSRAEEPNGLTSPEELIAAAHASCYCMQLSHELADAGLPPTELRASATVTFVPGTGITRSALQVTGVVPGASAEDFATHANAAKDKCPVSGALAGNVELAVEASLAA